jgi:hypothetical protein
MKVISALRRSLLVSKEFLTPVPGALVDPQVDRHG